jgi:hypothetical protein
MMMCVNGAWGVEPHGEAWFRFLQLRVVQLLQCHELEVLGVPFECRPRQGCSERVDRGILRVFKMGKQKEISGFGTTGSHHCL